MSGIFYCGDNLEVLSELIPSESVDLVYLDPPFNSQRTYNITYKDSRAQAEAFKDHWSWEEAAPQYAKLAEASTTPPRLRTLLRGLRDLLIDDDNDLLAYLSMMAPRIFALHRVLKPTGALYLHCDPTASHYLKLLLDATFGISRFVSEIIWQRTNVHNDAKRWSPVSDTLLFYAKTIDFTWNPAYRSHGEDYVASKYRHDDGDGRRYMLDNMTSPNPRPNMMYVWKGHASPTNGWRFSRETMAKLDAEGRIWYPDSKQKRPRIKKYLSDSRGTLLGNVWTDIDPINSRASERLGYPTQKPLDLLRRVVEASSNPGDLVLDPFCGCGTAIEACESLGRRWIGIDIARRAVEVTEERFQKLGAPPPTVEWHPPDRDAAAALAERSGIKFEAWARRKVRAVRRRKHDRGIDGEAFFRDEQNRMTHVLVSVKGGKLNPAMVRELRGTMERERAPIGVLVTLHEPSKEMRLEATHAGYLAESDSEGQIPRLQIVTVERLFSDRRPIRAPGVNVTQMPEPTVPVGESKQHEQLSLSLDLKPKARAVAKLKSVPPAPVERGGVRKTRPAEPVVLRVAEGGKTRARKR